MEIMVVYVKEKRKDSAYECMTTILNEMNRNYFIDSNNIWRISFAINN